SSDLDTLYGSGQMTRTNALPDAVAAAIEALGRQALHAAELGFEHPDTGEALHFAAPLPADMAGLRAALDTAKAGTA
ncbi:MAG: hypothetical protein ACON5L_04950, partial [Parvibaculales bacterium]